MSSDVTGLLERWRSGDGNALSELMPIVYDELHKIADGYLARERANHTLQPTALVHEAYLRLVGVTSAGFRNRAHFYGAAARSMRRILVDHARKNNAVKRGDDWTRVALEDVAALGFEATTALVELDDVLERLATVAPRAASVIEMRCFGGLSIQETAECLDVAPATVKRSWDFGRAWLYRALTS